MRAVNFLRDRAEVEIVGSVSVYVFRQNIERTVEDVALVLQRYIEGRRLPWEGVESEPIPQGTALSLMKSMDLVAPRDLPAGRMYFLKPQALELYEDLKEEGYYEDLSCRRLQKANLCLLD